MLAQYDDVQDVEDRKRCKIMIKDETETIESQDRPEPK